MNGFFEELKQYLEEQGIDTDLIEFTIRKDKNNLKFKRKIILEIPSSNNRVEYVDVLDNKPFGLSKINKHRYVCNCDDIRENILLNKEYIFDICQEFVTPSITFGCCSSYLECSDLKKCVNTDHKFAKGCQYLQNLNKGKIFYGKNRNV